MAQNKQTKGGFLGGAGRFNDAGENVPMPGETVSEVPPPPPFGGPRVWVSILVVIAMMAGLFMFYEKHSPTQSNTNCTSSDPNAPCNNDFAPPAPNSDQN